MTLDTRITSLRFEDEANGPLPEPSRLECGWCGAVLRDGAGHVSHGICPGCAGDLDRLFGYPEPHPPGCGCGYCLGG